METLEATLRQEKESKETEECAYCHKQLQEENAFLSPYNNLYCNENCYKDFLAD